MNISINKIAEKILRGMKHLKEEKDGSSWDTFE